MIMRTRKHPTSIRAAKARLKDHHSGRPLLSWRPVLECLESRVQPSTFTVTSTIGDIDSPGSLPWAIDQANMNPGPDTVNFNIDPGGAQTITPFFLPQITDAVTIDGTTQPGFAGQPLIELSGASGSSDY